MKSYIVYMHVSPSNKRYIGITSTKPEKRWNNGNGYKAQQYFYRAIKKYGWDNFEHIIVAKGLTEEDAKWLEMELIREWDSLDRNKGYNVSRGGDGCNPTEETRQKLRNTWNNKTDEKKNEIKRKISENHANMSGKNNPMYRKDWREGKTEKELKERGKKISEANSGKNNPASVPIICITTAKIFSTRNEGAIFYNIDETGISKCCKGKYKSAGKLPDKTKLKWMYLSDFLEKCNYISL